MATSERPLLSPARVVTGPESRTVFLNNRLELICKTHGTPKPTVIWYSNRLGQIRDEPQQSDQVRPLRIDQNNGSMIIDAVTKSHEDSYWCAAENESGSDKSRLAKIRVMGKALNKVAETTGCLGLGSKC